MQPDRKYTLRPPPAMRALSIRQPWLWAILHGGKSVENRDWAGCDYRGPVLLHASKGCGKGEFEDAVETIGEARVDLHLPSMTVPPLEQLPRGGLVGVARIADAVRHPGTWPESRWVVMSGYRMAEALGLELVDVRELPFAPWRGALGFFPVTHRELVAAAGLETADAYIAAWRELASKEVTRAA